MVKTLGVATLFFEANGDMEAVSNMINENNIDLKKVKELFKSIGIDVTFEGVEIAYEEHPEND